MKFLFYSCLFFILSKPVFAERTVHIGMCLKNGITGNLTEWSNSKDNFYIILNNMEGEEFKAKLVFFTFDKTNEKKQLLDFNKLPLITIANGISYLSASELLPSFSFDVPVVLEGELKLRVEMIPVRPRDFDFAALSDMNLKATKTSVKCADDPYHDYVISWDSQTKPGVAYSQAIQGKGPQSGIVVSNVNIKVNEAYFINVSNNIPTETYYEVNDDNTAYVPDPRYILTEELYTMLDLIDPGILEIMDNKKAEHKINHVIAYIDRLKKNAETGESADAPAPGTIETMMKENKKNDYVIKTNDQEEINGRIQEIYEKLNGLKTNISPTNNNQVNLAILTDFKDYLNQMLKCKKAISGDKIRMAGH